MPAMGITLAYFSPELVSRGARMSVLLLRLLIFHVSTYCVVMFSLGNPSNKNETTLKLSDQATGWAQNAGRWSGQGL